MIKDRQLKPGDKLPPERELSAMMNVGILLMKTFLILIMIIPVIAVAIALERYISRGC